MALRSFGQRDPLNEYKKEAFSMFKNMMYDLDDGFIRLLSHIELRPNDNADDLMPQESTKTTAIHNKAPNLVGSKNEGQNETFKHAELDANNPETWVRTPRNAPCPCGSGKKYKYCHGQI